MGLVQRQIEAAGFSTITLSNIPDLTAAVSVRRIAAIEYPFGLTVGLPATMPVNERRSVQLWPRYKRCRRPVVSVIYRSHSQKAQAT